MERPAATAPGSAIYFLFIAATLVGLAVTIVATRGLEAESWGFWLDEGGVIENLSALGYPVCIAVILAMGGTRFAWRYANLIILLVFLCLRELDVDKRFTTEGIFRLSFYLSPEALWFEKLVGAVVIVALAWAVLKFAEDHAVDCVKAFFRLHPAAVSVASAVGCMVVSKSLDGIARKLEPWGVEVSAETSLLLQDVEETLELGIPVFFIIAAVAYFRTGSRRAKVSGSAE